MPHAEYRVIRLHSRTARTHCISRCRQHFGNLIRTIVGQVEDIISKAHSEGKRIRVVGNALSPNGIGLSEDTMLSLGQCDRVLRVDKRAKTVTVEVRVSFQSAYGTVQNRRGGRWGSDLRVTRLCM